MKNSLASSLRGVLALLAITCAVSTLTFAADKDPVVSEKILKKYDLNKNGKLDPDEMAKWHADQKAAAEKKAAEKKPATPAPAAK